MVRTSDIAWSSVKPAFTNEVNTSCMAIAAVWRRPQPSLIAVVNVSESVVNGSTRATGAVAPLMTAAASSAEIGT